MSKVEPLFEKFFQFNRQKQEVRLGRYNVTATPDFDFTICYTKRVYDNDTLWQAENALVLSLPILVTQILLTILVTRLLIFLLKPFRQPRFVAETIAAIIMGPTVIGGFSFALQMFPFEYTTMYESISNLAITYYMFLAGLEIDLSSLKHIGKKPLAIAVSGIIIPFCVGFGLYYFPYETSRTAKDVIDADISYRFGSTIWAITLTTTSFSDLARILSEVKLLHSDIGRIALSSAVINDLSSWFFLLVVIIFRNGRLFYLVVFPTAAFVAILWFALRPALIAWMRRMKKRGEKFNDTHVHFALFAVCLSGVTADACGAHSIIGSFVMGLLIPQGEFAMKIMERTEEYVNGIMMPTFYFSIGYRTNYIFLKNRTQPFGIIMIVMLATVAKVFSTYIASLYLRMSSIDALALGTLLNTKGVFTLLVIQKGRGMKAISSIEMPILLIVTLFMTMMVGPIFFFVNKRINSNRRRKHRCIQKSSPESELRLLTCLHSARNASGIIGILEMSNPTRRSPINVFALHLVELTGRASAMLIVHDTHRLNANNNAPIHENPGPDQIFSAFEKYQIRSENVSVNPLTAVSPYSTMHEDIFNLAKDKRVSMIIVPFHKLPTATRELQDDNPSIQQVNQNLLIKPPCAVGILVDRGLGLMNRRSGSSSMDRESSRFLRLCVLFISGLDDHEALSYAWRMTSTPGVTLTVVRFLPLEDTSEETVKNTTNQDDNTSDIVSDNKIEKMFDDEFINEFRFKSMCDNAISYLEKHVNNGVELTQCIRTLYNDFDLYVVGRGEGVKSSLTVGLSEWSEHPELGPIGEALISTELTSHASVLVVQQSDPTDQPRAIRSQLLGSKFGQKKWASPVLNPEYEAFANSNRNKEHPY